MISSFVSHVCQLVCVCVHLAACTVAVVSEGLTETFQGPVEIAAPAPNAVEVFVKDHEAMGDALRTLRLWFSLTASLFPGNVEYVVESSSTWRASAVQV